MPAPIGCEGSQIVQYASPKAGLLKELTQSRRFSRFTDLEGAGGKLQSVPLHCRAILLDNDRGTRASTGTTVM